MNKPAPNTATRHNDHLMSLDRVHRTFGALRALDDVSFDIRRGEVLGVAGPNGAGKTTLMNICTGALPITSGQIVFEGHRVDRMPPYRRCQMGIARTFQIPHIFSSMSVRENVALGADFGQGPRAHGDHDTHISNVLEITGLSNQANAPVTAANLITRKRIMLAAALATRPRVIFLDEPMAGLNHDEVESFVELFRDLHNALDLTLVIVEHKIRALAALSQRILILNFGSVLTIDTPEKVLADKAVIDIYLGTQNLA